MSLNQEPGIPLALLVQLTLGSRLGGYLSSYPVDGWEAYAAAAFALSFADETAQLKGPSALARRKNVRSQSKPFSPRNPVAEPLQEQRRGPP